MSTKNILLSGGRAPATLELARLLSKQGHTITVMESIPSHVCQRSLSVEKLVYTPSPLTNPQGFQEALMEHIGREKIDVYIPTCEEIFCAAQVRDQLALLCECWLEPMDRLNLLHNKWTFLQEAIGLSRRLPHTLYLTSWDEVEIALVQQRRTDWILKPVYSRFSAEVQDLSKEKPVPVHISSQQPWILQEKIWGKQVCTYSLAYKGRLLLHSSYTTPYTAGRGGGILFAPYHNKGLQESIAHWIKEKEWTGQLSFDWIEEESGELIPIECNPRLTSGIHLFSNTDQVDVPFICPEKVGKVITPAKPQKRMLTLGMLLYGLQSCTNINQFMTWCKKMATYSDVVFRWKDPFPTYSQLKSVWYFIQQGRQKNISLLKASTEDIEWNGDLS